MTALATMILVLLTGSWLAERARSSHWPPTPLIQTLNYQASKIQQARANRCLSRAVFRWHPGYEVPAHMREFVIGQRRARLAKVRALASRCQPWYVTRQIRVTPYAAEDVGWIVAQAGAEVCLFSSDYPHVEGGRNPLRRFEASLADASLETKRRFYSENFIDLMGPMLG